MKIGDFAKKYDLNITTIRYYIQKALLTPEQRNNQYVFTRSCVEEMERILKYKSYNLTLEEIEQIFFLEKISGGKSEKVSQTISGIFEKKYLEIQEEIKVLEKSITKLKKEAEILSAPAPEDTEDIKKGIPIQFIPDFCCPNCHKTLDLNSVVISDSMITEGLLQCSCGYEASIDGGIILSSGHTEDSPFKVFDNICSVESLADEHSNSLRMLIDKAYLWLYHNIQNTENAANILAGPFTANFLLRYGDRLSKDQTVIIIDPSVNKLKTIRKYLNDFDFQTVFIAGDMSHIPVKPEWADIYIDDFSTTNSLFTYGKGVYKYISGLIKRSGTAAGIFGDYKQAHKSLQQIQKIHPEFSSEKTNMNTLKGGLSMNKINLTEEKVIGKTSGNTQHFPYNIPGEQLSIVGYTAVKQG